jgi:hypothetical protein
MEMTIDGHVIGSERSHNRGKRMPKQVGRKMSQEELDREFTELKERLNIIMELLQESDENQRYGWRLKRKDRWPIKN